jgi:hypothetical protein
MSYMSENSSEMEAIMSAMDSSSAFSSSVDLNTFDYTKLKNTIRRNSLWVMQLENLGIVDQKGKPVPEGSEHTTPAAQPAFSIYCYNNKGVFRIMHECKGLPMADDLLTYVQLQRSLSVRPLTTRQSRPRIHRDPPSSLKTCSTGGFPHLVPAAVTSQSCTTLSRFSSSTLHLAPGNSSRG